MKFARLLLEDVIPFVPDEVEGRVSADGVQGDGRDDAAAVLLSDSRVRREGHVQVPWQSKYIFLNHNQEYMYRGPWWFIDFDLGVPPVSQFVLPSLPNCHLRKQRQRNKTNKIKQNIVTNNHGHPVVVVLSTSEDH